MYRFFLYQHPLIIDNYPCDVKGAESSTPGEPLLSRASTQKPLMRFSPLTPAVRPIAIRSGYWTKTL